VGGIRIIRTEKVSRLSFDARIMAGNMSSKHEIINKSTLLEYVKQQRLKESLTLAYFIEVCIPSKHNKLLSINN